MTDYVAELYGEVIGVSVTRAMKYYGGRYERDDALNLLNKKLKGGIHRPTLCIDIAPYIPRLTS